MAGTHAVLLERVEGINDKYRSIRRLEASMAELHQMFVDMAHLVERQGAILDNIAFNIDRTKNQTGKAEAELITARRAQWASQKKMCCLTALMLIIVVVVIFPILFLGVTLRVIWAPILPNIGSGFNGILRLKLNFSFQSVKSNRSHTRVYRLATRGIIFAATAWGKSLLARKCCFQSAKSNRGPAQFGAKWAQNNP